MIKIVKKKRKEYWELTIDSKRYPYENEMVFEPHPIIPLLLMFIEYFERYDAYFINRFDVYTMSFLVSCKKESIILCFSNSDSFVLEYSGVVARYKDASDIMEVRITDMAIEFLDDLESDYDNWIRTLEKEYELEKQVIPKKERIIKELSVKLKYALDKHNYKYHGGETPKYRSVWEGIFEEIEEDRKVVSVEESNGTEQQVNDNPVAENTDK